MGLSRHVEILPIVGSRSGHTYFLDPQPCDETLIAEISPRVVCEFFCHRRQTDQLMVLRGSIDLVVVQGGCLRSIPLREDEASWVRIPPGVPHGAINRGRTPALLVNAVLRHGPSDDRDYRPRRLPRALQRQWHVLTGGVAA
jgi:mannose-6-phosphate isomerase-like protein (cupin superfamily)